MTGNIKHKAYRKIIAIILALILVIGVISVQFTDIGNATVTTTKQTGGTDANWIYTLSNGCATNVYTEDTTLPSNVTIPTTLDGYNVISIGDNGSPTGKCVVHGSMTTVKSVVVPSTVTTLNSSAFASCTNMESVTLPSSVETIGQFGFIYCKALTSINIPTSVKSIGAYALSNCTMLSNITIGDGVDICGAFVFNGYKEIIYSQSGKTLYFLPSTYTSYEIPSNVTSIGGYAFYNDSALTNISIPTSITYIGQSAFSNCTALDSLTIPSSVNYIGKRAFDTCIKLTSLTIPSSVTSPSESLFYRCTSLTDVSIPSSWTVIPDSLFSSCSALKSFHISESVTSIGNYAFQNCTALEHVDIPSSVTTIGFYAFANCSYSSSDKLTIPKNIQIINQYAFNKTPGVHYYASNTVAFNAATSYKDSTPWIAIDDVAPTVHTSVSTTPINTAEDIIISMTDDCGVAGYAVTTDSNTPVNWTNITYSKNTYQTYKIQTNGTYYAWVKDVGNNISCYKFYVTNIDTVAPTLSLTTTVNKSYRYATVYATTTDDNTVTTYYSMNENTKNSGDYFDRQFTVDANGTYYVYAVDAAGNGITKSVDITGIPASTDTSQSVDSTGGISMPIIANAEPLSFNIIVPLNLPVSIDSYGKATCATNAEVTNKSSYGCVKICGIYISPDDWQLLPMNSDFGSMRVNSKCCGLAINDEDATNYNLDTSNMAVMNVNDSDKILYNARISPMTASLTAENICNVIVVVSWNDYYMP